MSTVGVIIKEFIGLFIDDGSLAVAILIVVGLVATLTHYGLISSVLAGLLLFLALAAILIENLLRSARKLGGR